MAFDREEDEQETLASFAAAREEEYAGIQEDAAQALAQLQREKKRKRVKRTSTGICWNCAACVAGWKRRKAMTSSARINRRAQQTLEALAAVLPADDKPLRSSKQPAASPKTKPVPTALETAEKLRQLEKEREEQAEREERDDREMPVFLF